MPTGPTRAGCTGVTEDGDSDGDLQHLRVQGRRAGKRCGRPAVGHRDLTGQYPAKLKRRAVCERHAHMVDATTRVAMAAPDGWRVVPIVVDRGGRTLRLYRVSRHGVFVCECRTPAEVAAAGVPMAELCEDPAGPDA
jgi:hypothetical protein